MRSLPNILQYTLLISAICLAQTHSTLAAPQESAAPDQSTSTSLLDEKAFDDSFSKLPTNISADSLTLNAKQRVFVYKGNVTVDQGDMKLTSRTLEGIYGEDNQIQKLTAKGDVRITKQDIEATGQQALYDAASATVTLSNNPQLKQGESLLTADRIKVFLRENRSQAEGAVRVTLVKNKDAAAPSFLNVGRDSEQTPRGSSAAVVATPEPRGTTSSQQAKDKTVTAPPKVRNSKSR